MKSMFETQRLRIREMQITDFNHLFALDTDPEVMKYISDGKPDSEEQVRATIKRVIARYEDWKVYGAWAAEIKETGEFIGWFSLKPLPGTLEIEVGYRLLKKHWGKGYATEGATKMIEYGFQTLSLQKIVAITHPGNEASQKVLEKVGLRKTGEVDYQSTPDASQIRVVWFEISPK
jgi:RimJ/RimL family protein N-acetyltransferase